MSAHEWKPGDVAMVKCSDGEWRRASYFEMTFDPPAWVFQDNSRRRVADSVARRLVVIDDEDREQVERLIRAQVGSRAGCSDALVVSASSVDTMQAALRSLIAPLKPPEPTGLFAQIEDEDGGIWYRSAEQGSVWRRVRRNTDGKRYVGCDSEPRTYDSIAVVKVHNLGRSE